MIVVVRNERLVRRYSGGVGCREKDCDGKKNRGNVELGSLQNLNLCREDNSR
jgi:hypothetical protein